MAKQSEAAFAVEGDMLPPETRIDPDLARLGATRDNLPGKRVSAPRRRLPNEVPLIYRGRRLGLASDGAVDLVVPDEDNNAVVDELSSILEPKTRIAPDGTEVPNVRLLTGDKLHATGPSYHFTLNEATLVAAEDVDFCLNHPYWRIERADAYRSVPEDAPVYAGLSARSRRASAVR